VKSDSAPFMGGVWLNGSLGASGFARYMSSHAPGDVVASSSGAIRTIGPYCWCSLPVNCHVSPLRVDQVNGKRETAVILGPGYLDKGWK